MYTGGIDGSELKICAFQLVIEIRIVKKTWYLIAGTLVLGEFGDFITRPYCQNTASKTGPTETGSDLVVAFSSIGPPGQP